MMKEGGRPKTYYFGQESFDQAGGKNQRQVTRSRDTAVGDGEIERITQIMQSIFCFAVSAHWFIMISWLQ